MDIEKLFDKLYRSDVWFNVSMVALGVIFLSLVGIVAAVVYFYF